MTTTLSTNTYTSVEKVCRFVHLYTEVPVTVSSGNIIGSESIGTGDGKVVTFALANRKTVPSTERLYVDGTLKTVTTDYTLSYDDGIVTFTTAPASGKAVVGAYIYTDVEPSIISQHIARAENEIERRIGRKFSANNTALEFIDGTNFMYSTPYMYNTSTLLADMQGLKQDDNANVINYSVFTSYFPIQSIDVLATNKQVDQQYSNSNVNANQAFGTANYLAQEFTAGSSKPMVGASVYLKYNTGTSADITVGLYADSGSDTPTGSALATGTVTAFTTSYYEFYDVYFTTPYAVTAGTKYHIVLSSASAGASAYHWGINSAITSGVFSTSANSGSTWTGVTTKEAAFKTYVADAVVNSGDYSFYPDQGRITLNASANSKMPKGIQNVLIAYRYGYASVPLTVEELCTKLAAYYLIESRIMGDPNSSLSINEQKVQEIKRDIDRLWESLGTKLEARLVA